jgi:hypothetical protein
MLTRKVVTKEIVTGDEMDRGLIRDSSFVGCGKTEPNQWILAQAAEDAAPTQASLRDASATACPGLRPAGASAEPAPGNAATALRNFVPTRLCKTATREDR